MAEAQHTLHPEQGESQPAVVVRIWLLIVILAAIEVHRLIGIRYTTNDDAMGLIWFQSIWDSTIEAAQRYGRIQNFIQKPLWIFGLRFADGWTYDLLHCGILVAAHAAVFYVVRLYLGGKFAALFALIYVTTLVLVWEYNLLTSYPVVSYLPVLAGTLSLAFLYAYLQDRRPWVAFVSLILLLMSFFSYEFMPFLFTFLYVICLFSKGSTPKIDFQSNPVMRLAVGASMLLLLYLIAYVAYRNAWPSSYDGTQLAKSFRPLAIIKTAIGFSAHSSIYAWLWPPYTFAVTDVTNGGRITYSTELSKTILLGTSGLLHLLKASIAALVAFWLLRRPPQCPRGVLLGVCAIGVVVMLLPNLVIAITPKYQSLYLEAGRRYYAFTTFSHFGFSLVAVAIVVFILQASAERPFIQGMIKGGVILLLAVGGFCSSYANAIVSTSMQASSDRWRAVHLVVHTPELRELLRGRAVVGPKLEVRYWRIRPNAHYWRNYVKANYDTNIGFQNWSASPGQAPEIFFDYFKGQCGGFFVVLAESHSKPPGLITTRLHFVATRTPEDGLLKYRTADGMEHNIALRTVFNSALTATLNTKSLDPLSLQVTCAKDSR